MKIEKAHSLSFLHLLALLFIGLKLTDHIDWSWWWVLSPLWGLGMIIFVITCVSFATERD